MYERDLGFEGFSFLLAPIWHREHSGFSLALHQRERKLRRNVSMAVYWKPGWKSCQGKICHWNIYFPMPERLKQYSPERTFPGPQIPLWEKHMDHKAIRTVPYVIHRKSTSPQARQGPQQDRERHSSPPPGCSVPFKRHTHSLAQRRSLVQCSFPQKGKWTHGYLGTQAAWP